MMIVLKIWSCYMAPHGLCGLIIPSSDIAAFMGMVSVARPSENNRCGESCTHSLPKEPGDVSPNTGILVFWSAWHLCTEHRSNGEARP